MSMSQQIDGDVTARMFNLGQICHTYPDEARADFIGRTVEECEQGPCESFQCRGCQSTRCWRFIATSGDSSEYNVLGGEYTPNSNPRNMGSHFTSFQVARGQNVCFAACLGCESDSVSLRSELGLEGELADFLAEQPEERNDDVVADPPLSENMTLIGQGI